MQEKSSIILFFRILGPNHLPQPIPYTALDRRLPPGFLLHPGGWFLQPNFP